jgi:hypothetical protein
MSLQALAFLSISAICIVLAFTAEAFCLRVTGKEIPVKVGRSMLLVATIIFLVLAVREFLSVP